MKVAARGHDRPEPRRDRDLAGSRRRARRRSRATTVTIVVGHFKAGAAEPDDDRRRRRHDHDDAATTTIPGAVTRRIRVAVLAGGRSSEHEISLASARSVLEALDPERYEAVTVAIGRDGRWELGARRTRRRCPEGQDPGHVPPRRCRSRRATARRRRSARSTSCCRSCTGRSARTARCRACSSSPDVPYVGAGVAASALCMDKDLFKKVMRDSGIPVARARRAAPRRRDRGTRSATRCS